MKCNDLCNDFLKMGEYAASGAFEEPERSLFYRKALGIRRYYEHCPLYPYHGERLYPSGVRRETMRIFPGYLNGFIINGSGATDEEKTLIRQFEADFGKFRSKVPPQHTVAGDMYCHSIPNYGRIIREGLDSYAERIRRMKKPEMRDGLMHLYEGIRFYIGRCVRYLKEIGADPCLIEALRKVPLRKADTIYEALVSWNFILYLDNCDNLGCLAKELSDFYHGEDITPLLENLYSNLDANGGYSMALHGGNTELTLQCLRAAKGKRRPMIELFVDENTPKAVWDTAFDVMRSHGGQPAFYNPKLLDLLKQKFQISDADLENFCGGGCTESMIAGCSNVGSLDAGINLLLILEETLYKALPTADSFESFYREYLRNVQAVVDEVAEKISESQKERALYDPLPMRTLLIDDCIDAETEYNCGGARYKWSIVNFAGTVNVIDAMLTIKTFVFDEKRISAAGLCEKLKQGDEEFLSECRKCKIAFGRDNPDADRFAHALTAEIYSMFDGKKPYLGGAFLPASIQFMSQVNAGKAIGATPDGRKAGAPLCDSLAAIFGKDQNGPTALVRSVCSIALGKLTGVPILNFNIDEKWNNDILRALILSYLEMGGLQMQITCISKELLQEAYAHPEEHGNLVVRVGGYSEYFNRLSDELKKMILNRTVQEG